MNVFRKIKNSTQLLIITITGFALRIIAIRIDPFLHPWDERFHALVARNMMNTPFAPMLRAKLVTDNYDPFAWCCNHIWLHKQPLFMWQMALSMKLFGVSEWAMRLPSAIMGTLLIIILYRIALILTNNNKVALLSAFLLCFSNFHLKLISGITGMDHNDVAHGFYILTSFWAYAEYCRRPKWYWAVLAGIFSGAAILNKWLTGLLVFLGWGCNILFQWLKEKQANKEAIYHFLTALICCILVAAPWQIYILKTFPDLAKYEYAFNRKHIFEVVEGHGGNVFFYIEHLIPVLSAYAYLLLPWGIGIAIANRKKYQGALYRAIMISLLFVFLFFSVVVQTKIEAYLFFITPMAHILIAIALYQILQLSRKMWLKISVLFIVLIVNLNPFEIAEYLSDHNQERNNRIYNANIYRHVREYIPAGVKVVMNVNSFEDIDVMFYNPGITAYHWRLTEEDFKQLKRKQVPVAVFEERGNYNLPEYVTKYPYVYIIRKHLKEP